MKKSEHIKTNKIISSDTIQNADMLSIIEKKVNYIQEIIRNTTVSIQKYKQHEIFSNSDVAVCLSTLNELYEKVSSICVSTKHIDERIDMLQKIIDKLAVIICGFGTENIEDLIFINFGSEYVKDIQLDPIIDGKYQLIKKYLHPTGYKIVHWKSQNIISRNDHVKVNYCEDKITDETLIIDNVYNLECMNIDSNTKSFQYKIHGLQVVIQNEKQKRSLVISCIADDIILDFLSNAYINYRKKTILENIPSSNTFDKDIVLRIVESLTLKDILVFGNNDIYKKHISITSDVNYLKYNKLNVIIKKFLEMETYSQRNMLMNLLLYNKEDDIHYITYLLYDLITVQNNENIDSTEQKLIYESFPWKIKNYFKDTMKITVKYSQDMISKYDINKITLEQQIYLMKVPENVKEKAIMKFKEIKGKNDDSSVKTKQYLEGLLKIPFGVYKREPILNVIKNMNVRFIDLLHKNREYCQGVSIKTSYTKLEISNSMGKIQQTLHDNFIQNIKNKVKTAHTKQLTNIIQYIQTLQKNNIISLNINIQCSLTKAQKIKILCDILDAVHPQLKVNTELSTHFYKIYDIFEEQECKYLSKLPAEIKEIENSIKTTGDLLNSITEVLDTSVYGHTHAKNQILKIVGQWMTGEQSGYCFGFEGSPGVGKTSLAKRGLSNCLKDENGVSRPFSFIALGGSCNGSILEGHSYTYVNSTWGKIVDILMETKCMNPIIYIDELDKVSKTEHGKEIIGILTHLIDTTQNDVFQDKYYTGIDIDLSKALFIFSYNDPEQIDRILLDRIHRIKFENLTMDDKLVIVEKHILPEINSKMGFSNTVLLSKEIVEYIIESYTLEPGVRKLKEVLFDLFGEINIEILKGDLHATEIPIVITKEILDTKYLKNYHKIDEKKIGQSGKVGVINGLWANSLGKGGIIPIETVFFPSSSFLELRLTGLQGDVMKESMNVAKSLAWTLTDNTIKTELLTTFEKTKCQGIHIHCPDGSVSKDGPSAGTAITTALFSLFNNKKIKRHIAITGEINLQGDVTAIGGLEQKIFGGVRAGVTTFLYPSANKIDYEKVREKYKDKPFLDNIEFISISNIMEVFAHVFE